MQKARSHPAPTLFTYDAAQYITPNLDVTIKPHPHALKVGARLELLVGNWFQVLISLP
jgi:hypothetical protein